MSTAKQLEPSDLADTIDDAFEEVSGVRRRDDYRYAFISEREEEPTAVYLVLAGDDRRHFLGVRFGEGIIIAEDWAIDMWRAGVPHQVIVAAAAWLHQHAM